MQLALAVVCTWGKQLSEVAVGSFVLLWAVVVHSQLGRDRSVEQK